MHMILFPLAWLLLQGISVCIQAKPLMNSSDTFELLSYQERIWPDFYPNVSAFCKLEIIPKEYEDIKLQILKIMSSSDINLVYIHIEIRDKSYVSLKANIELKDRITEWQYVNKNEKFLVQLPVDVDLVTFNILQNIGDENMFTIPMRAENTNCTYTERTTESLKYTLWGQVLGNFSEKYVLCNRNFNNTSWQLAAYWTTSIWVGYDLTCNTRDDQPVDIWDFNIKPIVCFILALQYFWIYAFINFTNDGPNFSYGKGDSPYSLQRIRRKFLYLRLYNSENDTDGNTLGLCNCECFWDRIIKCCKCFRNQIDSPAMRLTFLIYIIILCPISMYRIFCRWNISNKEIHNYLKILKPSDPFCSLCTGDQEAHICDICIVLFSTILGLFLFLDAYNMLAGRYFGIEKKMEEKTLVDVFRNFSCCCCLPGTRIYFFWTRIDQLEKNSGSAPTLSFIKQH